MIVAKECRHFICLIALLCATCGVATGQDGGSPRSKSAAEAKADGETSGDARLPTFEELKAAGALRSSYRKHQQRSVGTEAPQPALAAFRKDILPVLQKSCVQCHGPETQEGNIRIDTLDPDLLHGDDVNWWLEIVSVLSDGEMPPADEAELADGDRSKLIEWLSSEIQVASTVRRAAQGHSSFRRMTRYEYNYALQDLLGLPYDFARDLPPEATSEDGFQNSSEVLHMSAIQFEAYRDLSRSALKRATVRGERPALIYWGVSMQAASAESWAQQDKELEKIRQQFKDDPEKLKQELERQLARFRSKPNGAHYKDLTTGQTANVSWGYGGAKYAWKPMQTRPEIPTDFNHVAIIPPRQKLIVELGDTIPDEGALRVRVRASRTSVEDHRIPSLQLEFGWQASNDSEASVRISDHDVAIEAALDRPEFYQFDIPLSEVYPRNSVRRISKMGDLPSPSEYIKLVNSSVSQGDIQLDFVEITAPVYEQWPPESHTRIFFDSANNADESIYAREVLTKCMSRAWRRRVTESEVDQKLTLFTTIRPACDDFQEAMIEVLPTVLSSPKFLYLVQADAEQPQPGSLSQDELATRLSMFLWCSTLDDELLELAAKGRLSNPDVLTGQVPRMLADSRSRRFSEQFVRQWLGMQLLDYLIQGKPVDASSLLFNGQKLDGVAGLKRFLLEHRQDQFARAMVHKMTTYALGRPLTFGDRSSVDQITADLRQQKDGLATMVKLIVTSQLFQSK